jgi:hypothetical protein
VKSDVGVGRVVSAGPGSYRHPAQVATIFIEVVTRTSTVMDWVEGAPYRVARSYSRYLAITTSLLHRCSGWAGMIFIIRAHHVVRANFGSRRRPSPEVLGRDRVIFALGLRGGHVSTSDRIRKISPLDPRCSR